MCLKALQRLTFAIAIALGLGASAFAQEPTLNCTMGPIKRVYGNAPWLVYSCDDGKSVVVVSAPDSPATPFYFTLFARQGRYELHGEGTGNQRVTDAAYTQIKQLNAKQIAALVLETRKVGSPVMRTTNT